jgi:cystathionine gamma-synthase
MSDKKAPETIAAANGIATDKAFGAVAPPIYLSSTFSFEGFEKARCYDYSRTANPSRDMLADTLAKLEGGSGAVVVSSGLAAIDLVLSRLECDQLVIAPHDCYAGTVRLLNARQERGEFTVAYINQNDAVALKRASRDIPSLILVETPSNPLMRIVDIAAIVNVAHNIGAKVAVDNTFLSPALQCPIALGADFVIHSTTKYLNGHSDVLGGAVIAADKADAEALAHWANVTGVVGAPFDAYMTLRGIRTLFPRMERQQRSAAAIAVFLSNQPQVSTVYYPGLPDHPGHYLACKQQKGFGAMLSFELKGGCDAVRTFVDSIRLFTFAESLGGVESLIAHPKTMTHADLSPDAMELAGITDGLLRLSIGLENHNDLLNDLLQALSAIS